MPRPTVDQLKDYVAYCARCGERIIWNKVSDQPSDPMSMNGRCSNDHRWNFLVDIDPSGTFGVMGFQCDNEDRIMEGD